jgi:RNA polymerase sigma factor (sigma-70 family)
MTDLILGETSPPARRPSLAAVETDAADRCDVRALIEQRLGCQRSRHLRYLQSRLRSREDAEDVLQDFTLKALQGADRVREDKVDAWLNVSLRNALFDRYRRDGARRRLNEAAAAEPAEGSERDDDVEEISIHCLSTSIAELKPSYATVLRRADLEEAPLKTVAEELGLTSNNVAVRLHRARELLRRLMHDRCSHCEARCLIAARFIDRRTA